MNFVYSKSFMIKSQCLDISNICPLDIKNLNIDIINIDLPNELLIDQNHYKKNKFNKWEKNNFKNKTIINKLPPDIKRITAILNKISNDNYDKMIEEAKTFNYADPEVVAIIFKKILSEPFFSDIYARFCNDLTDLHDIINKDCIIEFNKTKHKNIGKFIGELYKIGLINNIDSYLNILLTDIDENKLETLCKIINTIGNKDPIFNNIIKILDSMKSKFSPRYRFMILDVIENKNNLK